MDRYTRLAAIVLALALSTAGRAQEKTLARWSVGPAEFTAGEQELPLHGSEAIIKWSMHPDHLVRVRSDGTDSKDAVLIRSGASLVGATFGSRMIYCSLAREAGSSLHHCFVDLNDDGALDHYYRARNQSLFPPAFGPFRQKNLKGLRAPVPYEKLPAAAGPPVATMKLFYLGRDGKITPHLRFGLLGESDDGQEWLQGFKLSYKPAGGSIIVRDAKITVVSAAAGRVRLATDAHIPAPTSTDGP